MSEAAGSAQRGGAYRSSPCQWLREQRETERAARGAAGTGLKAAAAAGDRVWAQLETVAAGAACAGACSRQAAGLARVGSSGLSCQ